MSLSRKTMLLTIVLLAITAFSVNAASYVPNSNAKRSEVPKEYQWRPADIFKDDQSWESFFDSTNKSLPSIANCKGKLSESARTLKDCLEKYEEFALAVQKITSYAQFKYDVDQKSEHEKNMNDKAQMLSTEFSKAVSFIDPELILIPIETLKKYESKEDYLQTWSFYFDRLQRKKKHILSDKEEALIALAGDMTSKPEDIFSQFRLNVRFPKIQDETNKLVTLNFTNFTAFRESNNRKVRIDNAREFLKTLDSYVQTFAATLDFGVKRDVFLAQAKKYNSSIEYALEENYFTKSVYDNLIGTITENLPNSLHKYIELRKRIMKVNAVHFYDLYNSLVPSYDKKFNYEEGVKEIKEALLPLGDKYVSAFEIGSDPKNGWVDVYPNKNKDDGAYASALFKIHPYIKLNHQDSLDDVSTIAHEFGHALHYYLAEKKQPFIYFDPETMGTEVASTFNEEMLVSNLLKKTTDRKEKLYLLNRRLENIRLTFFRQALFAEFERTIHDEIEKKQPLTAEKLKKIYSDLIKKFYGPNFALGENDGVEWAFIPHFYYTFYVWKYSAGIAASMALAHNVLNNVPGASEKYINYLESGSSDYTLNLLQKAGVDLTKKESIQSIIDLFTQTVNEFEKTYYAKEKTKSKKG